MYGRWVNGEWRWGMPPITEDFWEIMEGCEEVFNENDKQVLDLP